MYDALATSPDTTPSGAARFLAFMEDELDPWIRSRYPTKGATSGILGNSFGGTFTFYAFLRQSPLFDAYWLGSPGLFTTDSDYIGQLAAVLAGELVADTRMYLSLGELEATGPVDYYRDMAVNYTRLIGVLDAAANPRLTYAAHVYAGHTHTSAFAPALTDALRYLYGGWSPPGLR